MIDYDEGQKLWELLHEAAERTRQGYVAGCPGHLWVVHVYEDEEDDNCGHSTYLTCERCPASDGDLYEDMWEVAEGPVSEDPDIWVEDLHVDPQYRGRSFPVNIKVKDYQHYEGDWDVHITVSPRTIEDQPPPQPNDGTSIQALVRKDLEEREQVGRERYGTSLQANNGRDALIDAYQEALDLVCYLRQAIEERGKGVTS